MAEEERNDLRMYIRNQYARGYKVHGAKATNALCVNYVAQSIMQLFSTWEDPFGGDLWAAVDMEIDWFAVASKLVDEHVPMKLNF